MLSRLSRRRSRLGMPNRRHGTWSRFPQSSASDRLWMHLYGCISMDAPLWMHLYGCTSMDASLWMHLYGCISMDAPLWSPVRVYSCTDDVYGCISMDASP